MGTSSQSRYLSFLRVRNFREVEKKACMMNFEELDSCKVFDGFERTLDRLVLLAPCLSADCETPGPAGHHSWIVRGLIG